MARARKTRTKDKVEIRIIVIDDAEFTRKTVVQILSDKGFNVVGEAGSAEEAISVIRTTPCNLFLIDIVMPDMSGIEFAKQVSDQFKDSSIIMMSSLGMENLVIESISHGAVDFIQKPFTKEDLINSVEKVAYHMQNNTD